MDKLIETLMERYKKLEALIKQIDKELERTPEGSLHVSECRGVPTYYQQKANKLHYINKANAILVSDLARKGYLLKLKPVLLSEMRAISRFLNEYSPESGANVYEKLHPARRELVHPLVLSDTQYAVEWKKKLLNLKEQNPHPRPVPENFLTLNREYVRSKSEKNIADTLFHRNIPYVYEAPLSLRGQIVYPDFTVLNISERKTFYWEHFGMMDDAAYLSGTIERMNLYAAGGYYLGDRLLATIETSDQPLRTRLVEGLTEKLLSQ